jgi:peptide/nickel transport system substrate-binding protein
MSGQIGNYWQLAARRRLSRRTVLRGSALAGAGLVGLPLLACKGGVPGGTSSSPSSKPAASSAGSGKDVNSLIGRTGKKATESPTTGGTYIDVTSSNAPTLDPHGSSSVLTMQAVSGVMSRLLKYKSAWEPQTKFDRVTEPDLALTAESPDAITWTFKLRPDAKFHNVAPVNGHPVEAEDIKATYTRATSPTNANRGSLGMIDPAQIQTPDKNTIVFKLKYPYAPFSKLMASGVYGWIFPREVAGGGYDPAKTIIGSGPFLLDSYTPDVAYNYKRNPDWFEKGRPYVDGVKRAIIPDQSQQIAQLTAGNLDVIFNLTEENIGQAQKQNPAAETYTDWGPGDGQMYFPLGSDTNSPFKDARLRRALSMLLDRTAMTKVAFNDKAEPDFYTPLSFGKWALHMDQLPPETAQWYKYDVQKAKQLIDAAGASNMALKMLSPTPFPPSGEATWFHQEREMVYSFLKAGQWQPSLVTIDYNKDWVGGGKGVRYGTFPSPNDSMVWAGLEGRQDVDEYVFGWYGGASSTNLSHLKDEKLDSMLEKARAIVNDDDRAKAYVDLQKYMADQMFSVAGNPNGLTYYLIRPRVRNWTYGDNYGIGTQTWSQLWIQK